MIYEISKLTGIDMDSLGSLMLEMNKEPRTYHTASNHIYDLCDKIIDARLGESTKDLLITAIMHDFIYDPLSMTNEEDSAEAYLSLEGEGVIQADNKERVYEAIIDTKDHKTRTPFSNIFSRFDLSIFGDSFDRILIYEHGIRKEFEFVDWEIYKAKRIEILQGLLIKNDIISHNRIMAENVERLISYVEFSVPRIAVYPGSFEPFHVGHANIFSKAEKIFDKVILAIGQNPDKPERGGRKPEGFDYKQVDFYNSSLVSYVESKSYPLTVIRGLRNSTDMQFELNQYRWLQERDPNIKVVSIFCDKEFEHISSSVIRSLNRYPDYDDIVKELV